MPESTFTIASALLLASLAISLLVIALISPLERRLVAGAALLLAGLFLLARPGLDLQSALLGTGTWAVGAALFFHAGFNWTRSQATKVGPLAVIFVLPPAFLGAILLGGIVLSILTGPVRLVLRLVGA